MKAEAFCCVATSGVVTLIPLASPIAFILGLLVRLPVLPAKTTGTTASRTREKCKGEAFFRGNGVRTWGLGAASCDYRVLGGVAAARIRTPRRALSHPRDGVVGTAAAAWVPQRRYQ